uniref:Integrase, catalytic region, zinc finger, CCHC-type, peptidase aspartic, catalytic n=1 Tax=Tanacetum cinerariifolium TaxID=118510 RepID=A0A6L2MMQ5_TANCI|nr:hypothetical protein [Tanacetum cinerariifolium]
MELYMMNRQHGRMILESIENGPLLWPTIKENRVTRPKKYSELSAMEASQADCDVKATNIILQGLPPEVYALVRNHKVTKELWERIQLLMQGTSLTKQERECKIYDEFDKFAYKKEESLLNTKFLNTLPPEWSKFMIDVKLVRDLHTTNIDQLHAYLGQHEFHSNEVCLMHERNSDLLALVSNHQMTQSPYQTHQQSYHHTQFQPQVSSFQSSQYGSPFQSSQYGLQAQSSTPLSITYPSNDFQSSVHQCLQSFIIHSSSEICSISSSTIRFFPTRFWYNRSSVPKRPTQVEVPKELSKVSMLNSSLKKFKYHFASFDVVVKERTTTTTITKGTWGFEHTKACFRDAIILFVKALKYLFNSFDQFLIDELSEVQNVFNQMEQAVEQHRVESNRFQDKMKEVLNKNERLMEQAISKDIVNIVVTANVNHAYVNECERCVTLETELQNDFIKKECYDKLFKQYTTLEKHYISLEVDTQLEQEIFQRNNSLQEKALVITALKDNLRKLKRKAVVNEAVPLHPIDPELLKNDVPPLAPKLQNNRTTHNDYLKHTQEETTTLKEIVKNKRLLNPLNTSLDYACNKLMAMTPVNKTKKIRFTEPITTSGNTPIKTTSSSNVVTNKPMLSSTGVNLPSSSSGS